MLCRRVFHGGSNILCWRWMCGRAVYGPLRPWIRVATGPVAKHANFIWSAISLIYINTRGMIQLRRVYSISSYIEEASHVKIRCGPDRYLHLYCNTFVL